jgi:hypothetical protein
LQRSATEFFHPLIVRKLTLMPDQWMIPRKPERQNAAKRLELFNTASL